MPDVRDARLWNERVSEFKDFAHTTGAEFEFRIMENGKECVEARLFYRPLKQEVSNGTTRS